MRWVKYSYTLLVGALALAPAAAAAELQDDFSRDPFAGGNSRWKIVGDAGLFVWEAAAENLAITWDSSRGNAFCVLPLDRPVTSNESFAFAWDLQLAMAGPRPGPERTNVLQLSVAMVRQSRLPDGYPLRTSAGRARELVDFSFFPLADYGPFGQAAYVAPVVFGANHAGYSFGNPHDLVDGQSHRIRCEWNPSTRRLHTTITGLPPVTPTDPPLPVEDDFSVDALAIVVWSEGPNPHDSLLARGTLDNIAITLADPIGHLAGPLVFDPSTRTVRFGSRLGYRYQLEASLDLAAWNVLGLALEGTGGELSVSDLRKAYFPQQFYRVRVETRP